MKLKIFSLLVIPLILIGLSCSTSSKISENTNQNNVNESNFEKEKVFAGEHGEFTSEGITQNRDISLYNQGYFDCAKNGLKTDPKINCDEDKIQDFIWRNWVDKKRAYVVITYDSVDAFASNHIFIEPDESGNWCIIWRIARKHAMPQYDNQIDEIPKIVSVELIKNKPKKGKSALAFKDVNGSIVQKIPYFVDDPLIIRG